MKTRLRWHALWTLTLCLFAGTCLAQPKPTDKEIVGKTDQYMNALVRLNRFNGSILVARVDSADLFLITSHSQDDMSIGARVERRLKSEEPRWKFNPRGTGGKAIRQVWEHKKEQVTVTINEMESANEAGETIQEMINLVALGIVVELAGVGDKAYLIQPSKQVIERDGYAGLVFIQQNVLVNLRANSERTIKRFANHIVNEIKVNNTPRKVSVNK